MLCNARKRKQDTYCERVKGLASVFLDSRLEHPAGWICARYKSSVLLLLLLSRDGSLPGRLGAKY